MGYKVIRYFVDLQDNNYEYHEGDTYPRLGYSATESRCKELSGYANKQGTPLIKAAENAIESVTEGSVEKPRRGKKKA